MVNAATAVEINVVPGQTIEWQNDTTTFIHIRVQTSSIGKYPLTENDFQVPARGGSTVGTKRNAVKTDALPGDYSFTRGLTEGGGKIIVQPG
jgi:hypothetical protein